MHITISEKTTFRIPEHNPVAYGGNDVINWLAQSCLYSKAATTGSSRCNT